MTGLFVLLLAHGLADPRVLVIVPSAEAIEIRLNDLEQPGEPSVTMRRRFDGNRDGALSDAERAKLEEFLASRATWNLKITQDGKPLALETAATSLRGVLGPIDGSEALSIDVVVRAKPAVKKGRAAVEIADRRQDGHVIRAAVQPDGVTLRKASAGSLDEAKNLLTGVELGSKSLRLEWEISPSSPASSGMRK